MRKLMLVRNAKEQSSPVNIVVDVDLIKSETSDFVIHAAVCDVVLGCEILND